MSGEPDLFAQVETDAARQRDRLTSPEHRARVRRLRRLDETFTTVLAVGSVVVNLAAVPLLIALDAAAISWLYLGAGLLGGGVTAAYRFGRLRHHRHGHTLAQLAGALSVAVAGTLPMVVLFTFMFSLW